MLDIKNRLFVFWDDNSVFSDISASMHDYARNSETVGLVSADDFLYVGFTKPINAVYVEMATANTAANTITGKFFNGTSFTALDGFLDDSKGFTRSGYMNWTRGQTDEDTTTIDSQEAFWYQFSVSVNHDVGTIIQGLNLVFADDQDLEEEVPGISGSNFLPSSATSHIMTHVSTRNDLIQRLRNKTNVKINLSDAKLRDITQWDILNFFQLRQAAKFKAIAKIYHNLSDAPDDIYAIKGNRYDALFTGAFDLFLFDLDKDNDGVEDFADQTFQSRVHMVRR